MHCLREDSRNSRQRIDLYGSEILCELYICSIEIPTLFELYPRERSRYISFFISRSQFKKKKNNNKLQLAGWAGRCTRWCCGRLGARACTHACTGPSWGLSTPSRRSRAGTAASTAAASRVRCARSTASSRIAGSTCLLVSWFVYLSLACLLARSILDLNLVFDHELISNIIINRCILRTVCHHTVKGDSVVGNNSHLKNVYECQGGTGTWRGKGG